MTERIRRSTRTLPVSPARAVAQRAEILRAAFRVLNGPTTDVRPTSVRITFACTGDGTNDSWIVARLAEEYGLESSIRAGDGHLFCTFARSAFERTEPSG